MRSQKIHTLDQLEKNIYRLKLEAKNMESRLGDNFDHLQKHYSSMTISSIISHFIKRSREEKGFREHIVSHIFSNEVLNAVTERIVDRLVDKAADGVENLIDRILNKKK